MRTLILVLLIALSPMVAHSQTIQMAKAERISRALGLDRILLETQSSSLQAVKEQVDVMLEQMRKAGMPKEALDKLSPGFQRLLEVVAKSWDPKVAARIYAEGLSSELTEEELAETERYYSTPAGAKAYRAIGESQRKMERYIQDQTSKALEPEMARFFEDVKRIASEAKRK